MLIDTKNFVLLSNFFGSALVLVLSRQKNVLEENADKFLHAFINGELKDDQMTSSIFDVDIEVNWYESMKTTILSRLLECPQEKRTNPYYSPNILKYLDRVAGKIVFWSAILSGNLQSPNQFAKSAALESFHNTTKNVMLDGKRCFIDEAIAAVEAIVDERLAFKGK